MGPLLQAVSARTDGTDGQLLEQFLARHDEAAFAALVRRHGPMVLGVCRRVLGNAADAEDAFQATFLVLLRRAPSLVGRAVLGAWLHGVALRTALKARVDCARRRAREQAGAKPEAAAPAVRNDWLPLLDEELGRLPEKYRLPVVLCDLEGRTRQEAAGLLACPEGTVAGRLARGRAMLAKRLLRRAGSLSAALSAALPGGVARAVLAPGLLAATVRAAVVVAAGEVTAPGTVSVPAVVLARGVVEAMIWNKVKIVMLLVLLAAGSAGAGGLAYRALAGEGQPRQTEERGEKPPVKKDREETSPRKAAEARGPNVQSEQAARWLETIKGRFSLALTGAPRATGLSFVTDKKAAAGRRGTVFLLSEDEAASIVQTLVDTGLWGRPDSLPGGPAPGRYLSVGPTDAEHNTVWVWRLGDPGDDISSLVIIRHLLDTLKGEREKTLREWLADGVKGKEKPPPAPPPKPGGGEPPLQEQLAKLDAMRNGEQTPFDEVEKQGKELLARFTQPEEQAKIYFMLAHVYGQSGIQLHPDRVTKYARLALRDERDSLQRAWLHTYLGCAVEVDPDARLRQFDERRRRAATAYLEGYKELLKLKLPDKAPELPAVGKVVENTDPREQEAARRKNEAEMQAWRQAKYLGELVAQRDILVRQVVELYRRPPAADAELRELAEHVLGDAKAADALVARLRPK
jgi:RNA polymerase sigma factor (sigma-70 family)